MTQKECGIKGDWFKTLREDFKFINEEIDDEKVVCYSKGQYKTYISEKSKKCSFYFIYGIKRKVKKETKVVRFYVFSLI